MSSVTSKEAKVLHIANYFCVPTTFMLLPIISNNFYHFYTCAEVAVEAVGLGQRSDKKECSFNN